MSNDAKVSYNGIGFGGLLGITFIVLKLCGVINWSWLWVLSPLWLPLVVAIVVLAVIFIFAAVSS